MNRGIIYLSPTKSSPKLFTKNRPGGRPTASPQARQPSCDPVATGAGDEASLELPHGHLLWAGDTGVQQRSPRSVQPPALLSEWASEFSKD